MKTEDILKKLGIDALNDMQKETLQTIAADKRDVVVLSPTGTGKTLAYLLPLVQLVDVQRDEVQAVVIVPGRELAMQSADVLKNTGAGVRSCACYGGRAAMDEHRMLRQVAPQIVFATPGRLLDHLQKGNISADAVKWLVIDEFDKCLEMGFEDEMQRCLSNLPQVERRILLSATDAEDIPHFVQLDHLCRLNYLGQEERPNDRVTVYEVKSPEKDKLATLKQLLLQLGDKSSIVFLNYRDSVERTSQYLTEEGFAVSSMHGGMEQRERESALYRFANGSANIFVSTDLASRGLDIPEVDFIIHYHLPETHDSYTHRVGRTARWDATGSTYFIIGPEEQMPDYVEEAQEVQLDESTADEEQKSSRLMPAKPRMTTLYIGKGKKDKISKGDIVGFLCKKGGLKSMDIGRIDVKDYYSYVAVVHGKADKTLRNLAGEKIKGIKTVVEMVKW